MRLRSLTKHVKDQNWFAVFLDFFIVVAGILIAFQITNWNEARSNNRLAGSYYERLASDIRATISDLSTNEKTAMNGMAEIEAFVAILNDPNAADAELVLTTHAYFTRGLNMTGFNTISATFEDLSSTGRLEILNNHEVVNALTELHADYRKQNEDSLVNSDWITTSDASLAEQFDWFRYDERTAHLFPEKTDQQLATEIRAAQNKLRRSATSHYWYHSTIVKDYQRTKTQASEVLKMIEDEKEKQ